MLVTTAQKGIQVIGKIVSVCYKIMSGQRISDLYKLVLVLLFPTSDSHRI